MNINVTLQPVEINVTVIEEPLGIKYENVNVSGFSVRELQTIREINGTSSTAKSERVLIHAGPSANTFYVYVNERIKGDPISVHVHFEDQDAELITSYSVSDNRVSFLAFEDLTDLYCTIRYLY